MNFAQLGGFFLASLIGFTILLCGIQFSRDILPVFSQGDSFMKEDFLVISRKINALHSLNPAAARFTKSEIEALRDFPGIIKVGAFTPARFKVTGGMQMEGTDLYFQTYLFFEAVPDEFLDVTTDSWHFNPGDTALPIIIPRTYLNLYNFGFAESRGMPRITEGLLKLLNMEVILRGNGTQRSLQGSVVGFTNRLNTILVPQDFMNWANQEFGEDGNADPVRLIVQANDVSDSQLTSYLEAHGYEVEGDKLKSGKLNHFLRIVIGVVLSIGVLISVLSLFVLILSVFLLVEKNADKLRNLSRIGYSSFQISKPYQVLSILLNLSAFVTALLLMVVVRNNYLGILKEMLPDVSFNSVLPTSCYGVLLFIILQGIEFIILQRRVDRMIK